MHLDTPPTRVLRAYYSVPEVVLLVMLRKLYACISHVGWVTTNSHVASYKPVERDPIQTHVHYTSYFDIVLFVSLAVFSSLACQGSKRPQLSLRRHQLNLEPSLKLHGVATMIGSWVNA